MNLVLEFDSDDPEFTRGFELGVFWESVIRDGKADKVMHATNAEMVMRVAAAKGLSFRAEELNDEFVRVILE